MEIIKKGNKKMEINKSGFMDLCRPKKADLFNWMKEQMTSYYGEKKVVATNDYLFCMGNISTMLCSHIDTVHKKAPKTFIDSKDSIRSPEGIGGDDRCGVYACLSVLKSLKKDGKKPYLFFSTDEEVGGASTKTAAKEVKQHIADVNYLIELDRANRDDSVYYQCNNKDFKKWINKFGFTEVQGTFTDICTLCEEWDVAGVNLSVGYYKPHTTSEYVVLSELAETIEKVLKIIKDTKEDVCFPFCKKKTYSYSGSITSYFKTDDSVITSKLTPMYANCGYGCTVCSIPAFTPLKIYETNSWWVKIFYNGRYGWISDINVSMDYN